MNRVVHPPLASNIFCAGHTWMKDGRLLVAGGLNETGPPPFNQPRESYYFDPAFIDGPTGPYSGNPWSPVFLMNDQRFYPTLIVLDQTNHQGAVFNVGGIPNFAVPIPGVVPWERIVSGQTTWTQLSYSYTTCPGGAPCPQIQFESYPRMFQLTNGSVFLAGDVHAPNEENPLSPSGTSWWLTPPVSPATQGTLNQAPSPAVDRYYAPAVLLHQLPYGSSGQPRRDRVVFFGGSQGAGSGNNVVHFGVQEFSVSANQWMNKVDLKCRRVYHNAVILPTGEILIVGGSGTDHQNSGGVWTPLNHPELYQAGNLPTDPGSTTYMAPPPGTHPVPRIYHHVTLLLPDGRVLVAGGENVPPPAPESAFIAEVFSPPYLFQGPRPLVQNVPTQTLAFGSQFTIATKLDHAEHFIDAVVVLRPGAVTHHFDGDQRYIELPFTASGPGPATIQVTVTAPTPELAPPGYYLLFLIRNAYESRIPSQGHFIHIQ